MQEYTKSILSPIAHPSGILKKLKPKRYLKPMKIEEIKNILERNIKTQFEPNNSICESPKFHRIMTSSSKSKSKVTQSKISFCPRRLKIKKRPMQTVQSFKVQSLHPTLKIMKSQIQPRYSFIERTKEIFIPNIKTRENRVVETCSISSASSDIENFRTMYH